MVALLSRLRALGRDRRGSVNLVYGLALVPMIGMVGLGADWFKQQSYNRRLNDAADAAAIAAVTTAKAYVSANSQQGNVNTQAVAAGIAQAYRIFAINAGTSAQSQPVTPTINFPAPTNSTFTATVSYNTSMPTNFGTLLGTPALPLKGSSTASVTIGLYLDFYVAVDVSGSMGIPTSTNGQTSLAQINPDMKSSYPSGCVFACHYAGYQGYGLAEGNSIPLRIDTVGQALSSMISLAAQQEQNNGIANEYRIGLFPFIVHAIDAAPLTANLTSVQTIANALGSTYLDQGWSNGGPAASTGVQIGSGGTHFENLTYDMPNYIKTFGNGLSASQPKPFLFLISDGMDNNQVYPFNGSQPQLPSTTFCSLAKAYNFTVAVLYIPYVPITNPNPNFAGDEDDRANNLIPQIPPLLQACASPGFFFTASSQSDINTALQTMFFQAVQSARLTQ